MKILSLLSSPSVIFAFRDPMMGREGTKIDGGTTRHALIAVTCDRWRCMPFWMRRWSIWNSRNNFPPIWASLKGICQRSNHLLCLLFLSGYKTKTSVAAVTFLLLRYFISIIFCFWQQTASHKHFKKSVSLN